MSARRKDTTVYVWLAVVSSEGVNGKKITRLSLHFRPSNLFHPKPQMAIKSQRIIYEAFGTVFYPYVVVQVIEGFLPSEAAKLIGDYFPLKQVIGVEMEFEVNEIHIPWDMQESTPSPEEIAACVRDLYSGCQRTAVSCSPDGNLREGYPAYLVAKMFGHDTIRGFCFA